MEAVFLISERNIYPSPLRTDSAVGIFLLHILLITVERNASRYHAKKRKTKL